MQNTDLKSGTCLNKKTHLDFSPEYINDIQKNMYFGHNQNRFLKIFLLFIDHPVQNCASFS